MHHPAEAEAANSKHRSEASSNKMEKPMPMYIQKNKIISIQHNVRRRCEKKRQQTRDSTWNSVRSSLSIHQKACMNYTE